MHILLLSMQILHSGVYFFCFAEEPGSGGVGERTPAVRTGPAEKGKIIIKRIQIRRGSEAYPVSKIKISRKAGNPIAAANQEK